VSKKAYRVALLPGDGVGPEVVREGQKVLDAVQERFDVDLRLEAFQCGAQYYEKTGREWEEGALEACQKEMDAMLLGAVGWPGVELPDGNIAGAGVVFGLRFGLDLYANERPCKLYRGVPHKISDEFRQVWKPENVNFTIIRENTEGLYAPARGSIVRGGVEDVAVDNNIITRKGAKRVIEYAFGASEEGSAPKDGKRRVTCIDKANVLRGSQMFRRIYDEVAAGHPDVERDYAYVDAFTQWMVRNPEFYHVAVTTNMLGDIVTDLASVLQGGMGMAAGGNIGVDKAMFEPIHGSAPKHTGKDRVNPMATVSSIEMMFGWLARRFEDKRCLEVADTIDAAVQKVLDDGVKTYDLGGSHKCSQVGDALAKAVATVEPAVAKEARA
jgi:3-isopropylmalate dehydrogenase